MGSDHSMLKPIVVYDIVSCWIGQQINGVKEDECQGKPSNMNRWVVCYYCQSGLDIHCCHLHHTRPFRIISSGNDRVI